MHLIQQIKFFCSSNIPLKIIATTNNPSTPVNNDYRPDIDGLRAIAVLAVVIFHGFPTLIHGGFVGVDIFFVISGYLISKHILEELRTGTFSIKTFYARRIRRIFPALILVMLTCLLFGWVILTPSEYEKLGRHVVAGVLFLSNFLFWKESGYFDSAVDTKPLLHLWSLGIEEQFYIVWPLFLAIFWRFNKHLNWAFLGVMGTSLAYSMIVVRHDVVGDFYSPFTRFWELALGAFLAYFVAQKIEVATTTKNVIAWLGLFMIIGAVLSIQSHFQFPGAWAILPTLGAASLIYSGKHAWLNRNLLSNKLLVWIGLISYPLYLWHWPLLSFVRIMESETPSANLRLWIILASFILAWLTYKFLERPVRARAKSNLIVYLLCLSLVLIGIAGFIVKTSHGYKSRQSGMLNGDANTMVLGADREKFKQGCGISEPKEQFKFSYCMNSGEDEPRYAVFGDSKAEAIFYGLARESGAGMPWVIIGSVQPPEVVNESNNVDQDRNMIALKTIVGNQTIKVVVLAEALRGIFPIDKESGFIAENALPPPGKIASYSRAIQQLEEAGKHVVFMVDNPTFPDPTSCISGGATSSAFLNQFLRRKENPRCTISYSDQITGTKPYSVFANTLKRLHPGMTLYDPTSLLCDTPNNLCTITHKGNFLYSYGDHLSDYANSMIARDLLRVIKNIDIQTTTNTSSTSKLIDSSQTTH